jgi:hypothetical protein
LKAVLSRTLKLSRARVGIFCQINRRVEVQIRQPKLKLGQRRITGWKRRTERLNFLE